VTIAELSIPNDWQEIMPAWMTGAIRRHYPDAVVSDVAVVLRDEGTNRRARLELTYSAGGPATVFVEAADPAHVELVALTSRLLHEPRLFTSGVVRLTIQPSTLRSSMRKDLTTPGWTTTRP
jgi:hypothetical protein